jgi:glyoxylase-like metal-dependent hydrolase (beta-lactamase superfamily II)
MRRKSISPYARAARTGPAAVPVLLAPAAVLLLLAPIAAPQAQGLKPAQPVTIEAVENDLYMISGEGGNVAVYVTSEGAVLVDNMFERNHDDILAAVASVTAQPIVYALNTHQHDDHAGGDRKLRAFADVIAQENVRANLSDIRQPYYQDTPGLPIGLPNLTFADRFAIHLGGKEVEALYFGRGHTNGDAVVYFPELRVIHTGDLFLGRRGPAAPDRPPGVNIYVDYAQGGSFLDWTTTLDRVLELDFETVIPGHGPVSTRADLVRFRADLEAMRDRIQGLIRMGASKAQILAVFESDYGWRSTGCPPSPPTPGCLQFQQMDALIAELSH